MNDRQRFLSTMHYQPRDRAPICDFGFWPETIDHWHAQGLPAWVTGGHDTRQTNAFFGMDTYSGGPRLHTGLCPAFPSSIIEDRGDQEVVQQGDGVRILRSKYMSSIPSHEGHLLVDRDSWREHYKPRLDPHHPQRQLPDAEEAVRIWCNPQRSTICTLDGGSLYGWIRNWMGLEQASLVVYDDPTWFEEMVETIADCVIGTMERAFATGGTFDALSMWEDMCFNGGPLLSPTHFKRFLVPHYRRIASLARQHGVDVLYVDCDGCIDELLPLWLDAGINCMFPIEVGSWKGDPVRYRHTYGRDLLMMGGFDKHILATTPQQIDREIDRLTPVVEDGGYIPFCDHRVPPDVPLSNYMHYLHQARNVWGRNVNLKPIGELDQGEASKLRPGDEESMVARPLNAN